MADPKQIDLLLKDVNAWNEWREANPDIEIDLRRADLGGADLTGADLRDANLTEAYLGGADLSAAGLNRANLKVADLWNINLGGADLTGANLRNADLTWADLSEAKLAGAKFMIASCGRTNFGFNDLSEVIDLEGIKHSAPSILGIETIRLSKGKIPEAFLRGCGLSDWEIETAKLHDPELSSDEIIKIQYKMFDLRARQAFQISSLFISYSHSDNEYVDKLEGYLDKKGIRFWRDVHHSTAGRLEKVIDRAMRLNPTLLLVLSKDSIQSDWVEHEVNDARKLEKELGRDVLCPVALDDSWKNAHWSQVLMDQVTKYNILDFSRWNDDDKFDEMFGRLVEGLDLFYRK